MRQEIIKVRSKLEVARTQVDNSNVHYFNMPKNRLDTLLIKNDVIWKLRAKTNWFREWDLNTHYFHVTVSSRRKVNRIEKLTDEFGAECRSVYGLHHIARDYFTSLFQRSSGVRSIVINLVPRSITIEDNVVLTTPFSYDEFKSAAFSMQADKYPGPNSFNPSFYKHF